MRQSWTDQGYFVVREFADAGTCAQMLTRAIEITRGDGAPVPNSLSLPEMQADMASREPDRPETTTSKVFRIHRDPVFAEFACSSAVLDLVVEIVGEDLDCFLSQFIFKNPEAWGQPWHQDSHYFPFDPPRPVVGVWLAVTEATLANGCLHVLPGSQREPVHEHIPDARPGANFGYMEIVDHDMSGATAVTMDPGDLLVFDSHLMHRSTDNHSSNLRAAMVYHYAAAHTVDQTEQLRGYTINDWMPVLRRGSSSNPGPRNAGRTHGE